MLSVDGYLISYGLRKLRFVLGSTNLITNARDQVSSLRSGKAAQLSPPLQL